MTRHSRRTLGASGLLVAAFALGAPAAALADPAPTDRPAGIRAATYTPSLTFTDTTDVTVSYGEEWSFPFTTTGPFVGNAVTAEMAGPYTGPISQIYLYGSGSEVRGALTSYGRPAAEPGSYDVYLTLRTSFYGDDFEASTASPAKLTVTPALLGVDARVVEDPLNPGRLVASASLTGEFIDVWGGLASYSGTDFDEGLPALPSGTWTVTVTDESGDVLAESSSNPDDPRPSFATSLSGLPFGSALTSTIEFVPDSASAPRFSITQAAPVGFTTAAEGRPELVVDAAGLDDEQVATQTGTTVPLGLVVLAGLIGAGALGAIVAMALRLRRSAPVASAAAVPANGSSGDAPVGDDEGSAR